MRIPTFTHRIALAIILIIWTWLLLKPNPVPQFVTESLMDDVKYVLGKLLHFFSFAFLAWYATVHVASKNWKWIWFALVGYAALTEVGQYYGDQWYQTHRKGSVYDVLIDSAGVLLGAYTRRFTSARWHMP